MKISKINNMVNIVIDNMVKMNIVDSMSPPLRVFTQPLRMSRMQHKVDFLSGV